MMKTSIRNVFALLTVTVLLTSCAKDDYNLETKAPLSKQEIVLNSGIVLATRAGLQDTQIENNQEVSLFITKTGDLSNALYSNVKLTANGLGGFSHTGVMYYPMEGSINVYAIHPYKDRTFTENSTFSVIADQTINGNYLNSDLLHVAKTGIAKSNQAIALLFKHKLSKIVFTIVKGGGISLAELNTVSIQNVLPTTTIDTETGLLTDATGTAINVLANGVSGSSDDSVNGIEAIIVPQTIASGSKLIKVTIGNANYYYTTTEAWNFEGGKKYNLKLNIKETGIELTSTIEDWINTEEIEGDGVA